MEPQLPVLSGKRSGSRLTQEKDALTTQMRQRVLL